MKLSRILLAIAAVWALSCCGNEKSAAEGVDKKDPTTTENVQVSDSDTQETMGETPEEKVESHRGMYEASEVAKGWEQRTITVPGQKSDIVALFEAFYGVWPTDAGNRIVHTANPKQFPEGEFYEEGSVIDVKNGYVESAWYEEADADLGMVSACLWNRKNGHKLFAVNFASEKDFLCFYDFDPAKRTLTPEKSPIKKEHLNFPDKDPAWYKLPHEGKTLEVIEDAPGDGVAMIYYEFDGQNLKFARREQ